MEMLAKIPLIPILLEAGDYKPAGMDVTTVSDSKKEEAVNKEEDKREEGDIEQRQPVTLLDWVSASNQNSLYQIAQTCIRHLEQVRVTLEVTSKLEYIK